MLFVHLRMYIEAGCDDRRANKTDPEIKSAEATQPGRERAGQSPVAISKYERGQDAPISDVSAPGESYEDVNFWPLTAFLTNICFNAIFGFMFVDGLRPSFFMGGTFKICIRKQRSGLL